MKAKCQIAAFLCCTVTSQAYRQSVERTRDVRHLGFAISPLNVTVPYFQNPIASADANDGNASGEDIERKRTLEWNQYLRDAKAVPSLFAQPDEPFDVMDCIGRGALVPAQHYQLVPDWLKYHKFEPYKGGSFKFTLKGLVLDQSKANLKALSIFLPDDLPEEEFSQLFKEMATQEEVKEASAYAKWMDKADQVLSPGDQTKQTHAAPLTATRSIPIQDEGSKPQKVPQLGLRTGSFLRRDECCGRQAILFLDHEQDSPVARMKCVGAGFKEDCRLRFGGKLKHVFGPASCREPYKCKRAGHPEIGRCGL